MVGRVKLACCSKAESGSSAYHAQGLLDCMSKMCPNSILCLHDVFNASRQSW